MTVTYFDPNEVRDNPYQPRRHYSRTDIDNRAKSIKEVGLKQIPDGRMVAGVPELQYGHIRKRAFIKLFKEDPVKWRFPVEIKKFSNEQMAIGGLTENIERSDITTMDIAFSVNKILADFPGYTETGLAKKLNMSQGYISNMLRVVKLPQVVHDKIDDGTLNFTMARELCAFQGISAGKYSEYDQEKKKPVEKEKDSAWLMEKVMQELKSHLRYHGGSATVNAIKKMIFEVCDTQFRRLEDGGSWHQDHNPLFDTRAAGCLKCKDMIRANITASEVRHFCTNEACWEKKQKAHIKKQASAAKKKMQLDIAEKVREAEAELAESIPHGIVESAAEAIAAEPVPTHIDDDITRHIPPEEVDYARERLEKLKDTDMCCKGCLNIGHCDSAQAHKNNDGSWSCEYLMRPEDVHKVRKKATDVPDEVKEIMKGAAGTRAQMLDMHELRCGGYNSDLKTGYTCLNEEVWIGGGNSWNGTRGTWLDNIVDPKECTERCTQGFHYAYDSKTRRHEFGYEGKETEVYFVCSNSKCLSRKKGAFTRAKNEVGQAKRKAENKAIKQAGEETTVIDRPRMIIIISSLMEAYDYRDRGELCDFLFDKLSPGTKKEARNKEQLMPLLHAKPLATDEQLAAYLIEGVLRKMQDSTNEMLHYQIRTKEPLSWLGIKVEVKKNEPKPDKNPVGAES